MQPKCLALAQTETLFSDLGFHLDQAEHKQKTLCLQKVPSFILISVAGLLQCHLVCSNSWPDNLTI